MDPQPVASGGRDALAIGLAAAQLPPLLARVGGGAWWVLDLPNHAPLLWSGLALLGAAAAWHRQRVAWILVALALLHGGRWLAPALVPADGPGTRPVRVLLANVNRSNPDPRPLLDLVAASDPDVVALLEVTPRWGDDLAPLRARYPRHAELLRDDHFGIALYGPATLSQPKPLELGDAGLPSLEADLDGTRLLATHPPPPISATIAAQRDAQLGDVARWMRAAPQRWIVAGDLNATPWSAAFPGAHRGGMPWGTWPSDSPVRLPIDHVLAGPGLAVVRRTVGPDIGSDHRPIIVDLRH